MIIIGSRVGPVQKEFYTQGDGGASVSKKVVPGGCLRNSFTSDTHIVLSDGKVKPIKDVVLGEQVLSHDPVSGQTQPRKVTSTIKHAVTAAVMVTVVFGAGASVDATTEHPFMVADTGQVSSHAVAAKDLKPGDQVRSPDGGTVAVFALQPWTSTTTTVYNLTIDHTHTYILHTSSNQTVVHNTTDECDVVTTSVDSLPTQVHHFATNKNKRYAPEFEKIADGYGLDLDDSWNKAPMPHQGRHPNDYHDFVLLNMQTAEAEAGADRDVFLDLFDQYVKEPILAAPELLRKSGWPK